MNPLDMFDPVYGNFVPVDSSQIISRDISKEQTGVYLQNQLRVDERWVLLAGARYDFARTNNRNHTAGGEEKANDEQLSLSGGIMYLADNGVSPYLSYTESFLPLPPDSPSPSQVPRIPAVT